MNLNYCDETENPHKAHRNACRWEVNDDPSKPERYLNRTPIAEASFGSLSKVASYEFYLRKLHSSLLLDLQKNKSYFLHHISPNNFFNSSRSFGRLLEYEKICNLMPFSDIQQEILIGLIGYSHASSKNEIQKIISKFRLLEVPYCETLALRLSELFDDSKEEFPYGPGIRLSSLRNFYNFLKMNKTLKRPAVSLSPDFNIYASWKGSDSEVFSAHFVSDTDVRYVVLVPNEKYPEKQRLGSGTTTYDDVMNSLSSYKIGNWVYRV